jgi:hypothetical protein
MKGKMKWILAAAGLGIVLVFSMLAPLAADVWTDRNTMGQLSYEKVVYETYEIAYYTSFSDKLDAIAGSLSDGASPYTVRLTEGQEALEDEALLQIANEELSTLYQNGLLPQEFELEKWTGREFMELYVLPQSEEDVPLQDICFWNLTAETADGTWLTFCMDSSFYKIYWIAFCLSGDEALQQVAAWETKTEQSEGEALAKGWCSYWGLEDAEIINAEDESASLGAIGNGASVIVDKNLAWQYDAVSVVDADLAWQYDVTSENGHKIGVVYRKNGDFVFLTGMREMMIQFGYN